MSKKHPVIWNATKAEGAIKSALDGTWTSMSEGQGQFVAVTSVVSKDFVPDYGKLIGKKMKGGAAL